MDTKSAGYIGTCNAEAQRCLGFRDILPPSSGSPWSFRWKPCLSGRRCMSFKITVLSVQSQELKPKPSTLSRILNRDSCTLKPKPEPETRISTTKCGALGPFQPRSEHKHTHEYAHAHTRTHAHTETYTRAHTHTQIYIYIYTYTHTYGNGYRVATSVGIRNFVFCRDVQ